MRLTKHSRGALVCEYALATSLIAILFFIVHVMESTDEQVLKLWANGEGALIIVAAMHAWLTAPLLIVLGFGYLVRRVMAASPARLGRQTRGDQSLASSRLGIRLIVYGSEAAFIAAISDVALATLVSLEAHNNTHWLLYPWGIMALATIGICFLRAVFDLQSMDTSARAISGETDPSDQARDWFGEAAMAAMFSSLIPVVGMGWMHNSDDPLTADLTSVQPVALAIAMIPIALMIMRRGAIRALYYAKGPRDLTGQ
jgi:hypothetical protein